MRGRITCWSLLVKKIVLAVTLIALSACAKKPDQIAATNIGDSAYRGQSCQQLNQAKTKIRHDLDNLSAAQKSAATGDAWGVFLLGLPLSSLSGNDREAAISVAKGHVQAIETEQQRKGCK